MYKFNLVKKVNPSNREAPKRWYAVPLSETPLDVKSMARAATKNTTIGAMELEAAIELLGEYAIEQLQQGHTVRLGAIGTLRLSFSSEGVEDILAFNAVKMIHSPRVIFTPSKEFRTMLLKGLLFENGGVLDEGVNYASLSAYKKAKGIGGDEGETPDIPGGI